MVRARTRATVRAIPALVAALCLIGLVAGLLPAGAQAGDGSGGSADQIDVLTATRDQVRAELAELDRRSREQRELVEAARAEVAAADARAEAARAEVEAARQELGIAREVVADYAVEAYMRPPAADRLRALSLADADDAGFAHSVMEIMTERRQQVVDELVAQQQIVLRREEDAERAAGAARAAAEEAERQLAGLEQLREEQEELARQMDERLDDALAEAAALAAIDQAASDALVADEVALRNEGPVAPAPEPGDVSVVGNPTGPAPPTTRPTTPTTGPAVVPRVTTTTRLPSPTTTRPPSTTRPPTTTRPRPGVTVPTSGVTWADVTSVGGIWVHRSIAGNVRALLNAATAAGFSLRGGGYRDPAAQIATRRANCGPTPYDIYEKPASQCTPPTARPGRSMHERGMAIDFTSSGRLITSRSDPAFVWLRNNAARFGFYNLPSEPWHWSVNGN